MLGPGVYCSLHRCRRSGARVSRNPVALARCRRVRARRRAVSGRRIIGHDAGGDARRLPDPSLLRGLHVRRPGLCALLRLHEPVRGRHADSGTGRQSAAAVSGMGRRGAVQLPADRLLVCGSRQRPGRAQGLHRHPRGRHRHGAGSAAAVHPVRHAGHPESDGARALVLVRWLVRWPSRPPPCCWAERLASRRSCRCRPGCPTPWPAPRRSAR